MSTPCFVYLRRVNTIADEPEAGTRCSVERKKEKKERKKDNFEVHPTNTAAKLTGKQDRSTARVGGFNPELVRLRRRSAPVSLVRTLRVLPSRSPSVLVSLSLSLSSLPNLSFSPFLSSSLPLATFVDASPSIRLSLSFLFSRSLLSLIFYPLRLLWLHFLSLSFSLTIIVCTSSSLRPSETSLIVSCASLLTPLSSSLSDRDLDHSCSSKLALSPFVSLI